MNSLLTRKNRISKWNLNRVTETQHGWRSGPGILLETVAALYHDGSVTLRLPGEVRDWPDSWLHCMFHVICIMISVSHVSRWLWSVTPEQWPVSRPPGQSGGLMSPVAISSCDKIRERRALWGAFAGSDTGQRIYLETQTEYYSVPLSFKSYISLHLVNIFIQSL